MANSYYTVTSNPPAQTRGSSATVRSEFIAIQTGFDGVAARFTTTDAAIAAKGAIAGQTWTGAHNFVGGTITVPTLTYGASGANAASVDYVNNAAFQAALPGQVLGFLRSTGTVASFGTSFAGFAANEVKGADIASAATINLTTATGNFVHVTGTATISAITIPIGAERTVTFDGSLTLTHSASLLLPGSANITTQANDRMVVRGDTAGAIVTGYTKADGTAVRSGLILLATLTPSAAANVDFLTAFSATYDNYLILGQGLLPSADQALSMRFANAGTVDAGSGYYTITPGGSTTTSTTSSSITNGAVVLATGKGLDFQMTVSNVNDPATMKSHVCSASLQGNATTYTSSQVSTFYPAANTISGIRLFWASGANFQAQGKIRIYGYQNS